MGALVVQGKGQDRLPRQVDGRSAEDPRGVPWATGERPVGLDYWLSYSCQLLPSIRNCVFTLAPSFCFLQSAASLSAPTPSGGSEAARRDRGPSIRFPAGQQDLGVSEGTKKNVMGSPPLVCMERRRSPRRRPRQGPRSSGRPRTLALLSKVFCPLSAALPPWTVAAAAATAAAVAAAAPPPPSCDPAAAAAAAAFWSPISSVTLLACVARARSRA